LIKERKRIAFVKFAGLSSGGTERWLQEMAVALTELGYEIDFFYCDTAPYIGSNYKHSGTDLERLRYMKKSKVNLIEFSVEFKDIRDPEHPWIGTNFWDVFNENDYLFVQTAKAGPLEYPYSRMKIPVIEYVTLSAGVDLSSNIAWTIHLSQWQRKEWGSRGGNLSKSSIVPIPVSPPKHNRNLRGELGIQTGEHVFGFHQRVADEIYSPIPLEAFAKISDLSMRFIIMGGSDRYREQAKILNLQNVIFLPHNSNELEISKFLNTLDVYAHGRADGETFGTVLAEAMIHGVPCLSHASKVGANAQPETMGPGGLFAGNLKQYEAHLLALSRSSALRLEIGESGRNHAKKYYSLESCSSQLLNVYSSLFPDYFELTDQPHKIEYGLSSYGYLLAGNLSDRASLANNVLVGGKPEEFEVELLYHFGGENGAILDVGSNIGLYSLVYAFRTKNRKIHAFEPQPECISYLKETIVLNRWASKFQAWNIALSNVNGFAKLQETGTGSSINSKFNNDSSLKYLDIKTQTLDEWSKIYFPERVGVIKIDVEGHEFEVLTGGIETISHWRPVVFVEIAKTFSVRGFINESFAETLQIFADIDYRVFIVTTNGWLKCGNNSGVPDGVNMFICFPKESSPNLFALNLFSLRFKSKKAAEKSMRLLRKISLLRGKVQRIAIYRIRRIRSA